MRTIQEVRDYFKAALKNAYPDAFAETMIDINDLYAINDAIALLEKQREIIDKLYDYLEETCKDTREQTGEDYVCGFCQYDGAYRTDSGDWANECPGFESDECFCMSNKIREMCGKPLLPEP